MDRITLPPGWQWVVLSIDREFPRESLSGDAGRCGGVVGSKPAFGQSPGEPSACCCLRISSARVSTHLSWKGYPERIGTLQSAAIASRWRWSTRKIRPGQNDYWQGILTFAELLYTPVVRSQALTARLCPQLTYPDHVNLPRLVVATPEVSNWPPISELCTSTSIRLLFAKLGRPHTEHRKEGQLEPAGADLGSQVPT